VELVDGAVSHQPGAANGRAERDVAVDNMVDVQYTASGTVSGISGSVDRMFTTAI